MSGIEIFGVVVGVCLISVFFILVILYRIRRRKEIDKNKF